MMELFINKGDNHSTINKVRKDRIYNGLQCMVFIQEKTRKEYKSDIVNS